MSHITRRRFLKGSGTVVGAGTLASLGAWQLLPPTPPSPTKIVFFHEVPLADFATYSAFSEALTEPILQDIRKTSIMRQLVDVNRLRGGV